MLVGSKWYKFDFHNHTPSSHDYLHPETTDREWLLAYMNLEIDGVIISDHNSGGQIDSLKRELKLMREEALAGKKNGYRALTLFPGVELTATGNVHILAVLHEDSTNAQIERLIGQCNDNAPISRHEKNHQLVLQKGPAGIVSIIKQDPEAICILAHIDGPKGVLTSLTNQAELEAAFDAGPHAVEIRGALADITDGTHRRLISSLPKVRGSDAHSPEYAGGRICWLKMSELNFDGLRSALQDHDNCVIFDGSPPALPSLRLKSLRLKTRLCTLPDGQPAEITFNPFYNAVIGSRGTGKSTLIESIRLAMRKDTGLSHSHAQSVARFSQIGGGMSDTSFVECLYIKDGTEFKLVWRPGGVTELHVLENDEWVEDPNWSPERFGISIYSQKMLFELASDNNAFLEVCDNSKAVNKRVWTDRNEQLIREFKNEMITLRGLHAQKLIASALSGEDGDVSKSIAKLSESAYFPVRTRLAAATAALSEAEEAVTQSKTRVESVKAILTPALADEELNVADGVATAAINNNNIADAIASHRKAFDERLTELAEWSLSEINKIELGQSMKDLRESVDAETANATYEAARLREQDLDPDALDALLVRQEEIAADLKVHAGTDERIETSQNKVAQLTEEIRSHRMRLTELRKAFIASLPLEDLEVKILPLAEPCQFLVAGYQEVTGITAYGDRIYDEYEKSGLLSDFFQHQVFSPHAKVIEKKYALLDSVRELHRQAREDKLPEGVDIHGAFLKKLKGLSDESFDSLMCWYPDDGIYIRYRSLNGAMEDISTASPGQKGASMLQFLLSYGTDPLLLDQPEDDLDCLMLSQSVIPAIVANKKRRQLIIVSHSAPIVVNGDAEYVINMTHDSQGLRPHLCGALQQKEMKDMICKQMEGGEKAFRSRYSRILS